MSAKETIPPDIRTQVEERLEFLKTTHGTLTAAIVVDDAQDAESILHGLFDWNVDAAARKYWEIRARFIIRSVRIRVSEEVTAVKAPYYVRDPIAPGRLQGYTTFTAIQDDPVRARQALRQELGRMETAARRGQPYADVLGIREQWDSLVAHVLKLNREIAEMTPTPPSDPPPVGDVAAS